MAKKDKRFIIREKAPNTDKRTKVGSFDTYAEACDVVERIPKDRIPKCSIEDRELVL